MPVVGDRGDEFVDEADDSDGDRQPARPTSTIGPARNIRRRESTVEGTALVNEPPDIGFVVKAGFSYRVVSHYLVMMIQCLLLFLDRSLKVGSRPHEVTDEHDTSNQSLKNHQIVPTTCDRWPPVFIMDGIVSYSNEPSPSSSP